MGKWLCSLSLIIIVGSCATIQPSYRDNRFIIYNHGDFTNEEIQRVKTQLYIGRKALEKQISSIPTHPVIINLWPGRGVSFSHHGKGPIELYHVRAVRAPIIHELTHVLAGYTRSNSHWTQEGFASYMQDEYGQALAFPTYKRSHALTKVLIEENSFLPMLDVMKDRNRNKYFGMNSPWERWLAYTQSTSFCRYLIEKYGMDNFFVIYDKRFERINFLKPYGKSSDELVSEWKIYLSLLDVGTARARRIYRRVYERNN